jgi:hypothetical protein
LLDDFSSKDCIAKEGKKNRNYIFVVFLEGDPAHIVPDIIRPPVWFNY